MNAEGSRVSNGVMTIIHTDPALTDEGAPQCCHFFLFFLSPKITIVTSWLQVPVLVAVNVAVCGDKGAI